MKNIHSHKSLCWLQPNIFSVSRTKFSFISNQCITTLPQIRYLLTLFEGSQLLAHWVDEPPLAHKILHRRYTITKVTCIDVLEWDDLVPLTVDEAISQWQVCSSD